LPSFLGLLRKTRRADFPAWVCKEREAKTTFRGTVVIRKGDVYFVATCIENNVALQGETIDEAVENLKEAIAFPNNERVYITSLEMAI